VYRKELNTIESAPQIQAREVSPLFIYSPPRLFVGFDELEPNHNLHLSRYLEEGLKDERVGTHIIIIIAIQLWIEVGSGGTEREREREKQRRLRVETRETHSRPTFTSFTFPSFINTSGATNEPLN
jgi:hypothetical protein